MKTTNGRELPTNNETTDFPLVVVTKDDRQIPMTLSQLKRLLKAQNQRTKGEQP